MLSRKIISVALVVIFAAALSGCATNGYYDPYRSAAAGGLGGAAVGAALGSIIGAATGSAATGAWVGAAAGGVLGTVGGALYAHHQNTQMRNYAMAAQSYNYSPAQGRSIIDINEASASPYQVRPGSQVNLTMTYTILTPDNAPTTVTLVREVSKDGQPVGQPYQVQATNPNGTHQDRVAFGISPQAGPGTYMVRNRVISSYGVAERVSYFQVI